MRGRGRKGAGRHRLLRPLGEGRCVVDTIATDIHYGGGRGASSPSPLLIISVTKIQPYPRVSCHSSTGSRHPVGVG